METIQGTKKSSRLGPASITSEHTPLRGTNLESREKPKDSNNAISSMEACVSVDQNSKLRENLMGTSSNGYTKLEFEKYGKHQTAFYQKTTPSTALNGSLQHGSNSSRTRALALARSSPNSSAIPGAPHGSHENRRLGPETSRIPQYGSQTARATLPALLSLRKAEAPRPTDEAVPYLPEVKNQFLGFGTTGGIDAAKTERSYGQGPSMTNAQRTTVALTSRQRSPRRAGGGSGSATTRSSTKTTNFNTSLGTNNNLSMNPVSQSGPMTVGDVLHRYRDQLTDFEQSEILHYSKIYFIGKTKHKIKGNPHSSYLNYGYDDDRGDYTTVAHDHIAFRYEICSSMGKGSFGQVLKCFDHKTRSFVALKIIRNKRRFHAQAMIEVKVLQRLRQQDSDDCHNVVHLKESFFFRNHLCITFELMSINLYEMTKQNNFEGVSLALTRRFAMQILVSLKFLRSQRIVHCDLKPENILLKELNRSAIKVIDFGSSCFEEETQYTYIQSRFYRAPEVILGLPYGTPIDMWSLGCILAELYTGCPIFPGENEQEQLLCIMEVLGEPPRSMLGSAAKRGMFFDASYRPRIVPSSRGKKRYPGTRDIASKIRCKDRLFLTFLESCLRWEPSQRMTPEEALQHQWITERPPPATQRVQPTTAVSSAPNQHHYDFKHGWNNNNHTVNGGDGSETVVDTSSNHLLPPPPPLPPATVQQPQASKVEQQGSPYSARLGQYKEFANERKLAVAAAAAAAASTPISSTTENKNLPPIDTFLRQVLSLRQ